MKELEEAQGCVICLTQESNKSPWVYFEAGAIAIKHRNSLVCPYLIDFKESDLAGSPLSQFQAVPSNKEGTLKLIESVNFSLADQGKGSHNQDLIKSSFLEKWPSFSKKLENKLTTTLQSKVPSLEDILPPKS